MWQLYCSVSCWYDSQKSRWQYMFIIVYGLVVALDSLFVCVTDRPSWSRCCLYYQLCLVCAVYHFFSMQNNILCVGILLLVTCICLIIICIMCTVCLLYQLQATGNICLPLVVSACGIYICMVCLCSRCMSVCQVV